MFSFLNWSWRKWGS